MRDMTGAKSGSSDETSHVPNATIDAASVFCCSPLAWFARLKTFSRSGRASNMSA